MTNEPAPGKQSPPPRQMNGCLSTWLWVIIALNVVSVILTLIRPGDLAKIEYPSWYLPVTITATVLVVIFAIALLKWRAWGFWGLAAMEGVSVLITIWESGNYWSIISGALGVGILVLLLNLGGKDKAWNYLK